MALSKKPLVWLPFAAGGMLAALLLPALMLVILLHALGIIPAAALEYERIRALAQQPHAAVALFLLLGLFLWHAAHRLRMTIQDLGARSDRARRITAWSCYLAALFGTLALLYALLII